MKMVNYWLAKQEPGGPRGYNFETLKKDKKTVWDGVHNNLALKHMREMKDGDLVLFYHSSTDPNAVYGYCEITREGYPDHTQFDPDNEHFFPSADPANPAWYMVDLKLVKEFKTPVTLTQIKGNIKLKNMLLTKKGNRLSVMPVAKEEFDEVVKMGSK